jgi:RNA polymerase sigma-70 factor (ECF subfamily)
MPAGDGEMAGAPTLAPFEELYRSHAGSVHRFCLSQGYDSVAAEDITHETFFKAFVAYQRVGPHLTSARVWLLAIARNLCADQQRRRGRWRRLWSRLAERPAVAGSVETVAEHRADIERVTIALAGFSDRERQLIGLRVAAGLSYREIAELMRASEAAAKVATHRALTKLRACLESSR